MRILAVGDVHYRLRQYDWIYDVAGSFDAVVLAGDLLDIRSVVGIPAQAAAVSAQLARIAERSVVIAASGNHDLDDLDGNREKVAGWLRRISAPGLHSDGTSVQVGDTLVSAYGWWDGPHGRDALEAQLVVDAARRPAHWIWVYHAPPAGSPLAWDGRREFGDSEVLAWIERFQPDAVLAGHIHQAPFVDGGGWCDRVGSTRVFNAGQQPGPVPTHIVLDLDVGEARWVSATEEHEIALAG